MGVDLMLACAHNYDKDELLSLDEHLNKRSQLNDLYHSFLKAYDVYSNSPYEKKDLNIHWSNAYAIDELEENWYSMEVSDPESLYLPPHLTSSFGFIYLYRRTLNFAFFWKYFCLKQDEMGLALLKFGKELLRIIGQKEAFFFPDSAIETHAIEDKLELGWSFEEIKIWALESFGPPATNPLELKHGNGYLLIQI